MNFTSLQNLSSASLLASPTKINDLVETAKGRGYQAIALTDLDFTFGLVEFYEAAVQNGIKPILGTQIQTPGIIDSVNNFRLILLAKNNNGYQNLLKITSAISLKKNSVQLRELTKYLHDLIIITPANNESELVKIIAENSKSSDSYVRELIEILPKDNELYLGVYGREEKVNFIDQTKSLSKQFNVPIVAVEDVNYLNPTDQFERKILQNVKENTKIVNPLNLVDGKGSHYLLSQTEFVKKYQDLGLIDALENTKKIAAAVDVTIEKTPVFLPKFPQDIADTSKEYLEILVKQGIKTRFNGHEIPEKYRNRLNYELQIINEMGFADYFLIVADVVHFAHKNQIPIGPGRGSAAGSLVSFALAITEVDPLKYDLIFERFLNPARKQMPDIDLDIADDRRQEVIDYLFDKYGIDHVAQIITFGTFKMKQAVRDVGRVFGLSQLELSRWSKLLDRTNANNLTQAFETSKEFQALVLANDLNKLIYQSALKIEGLPKNSSTHAAGIVLTDQSLAAKVGLMDSGSLVPVTQQTMAYVEKLGILKIDLLGLRNLSLLANIKKTLQQNGVEIDFAKIPLNDQPTLLMFQRGETEGIFQFDKSPGAKRILKEVKPDRFEDIVAINALNRPGPSDEVPEFAARKNGQSQINFVDPKLKPILANTYGIILYQEQVMQVAQVFASYSMSEADTLRRAVSKKKKDDILAQQAQFIDGAVKLGHDEKIARKFFDDIESFGGYGFNKSHAVAYSLISYWLAYLKVHYPASFYLSLMNQSLQNETKLRQYLTTLQFQGIKILPPDINKSHQEFVLEGENIRMGFLSIKDVSRALSNEIVKKRDHPYKDLYDFLHRLDPKLQKADSISNLILAGSFDQINKNRHELVSMVQPAIESIKISGNNVTLFDIVKPKDVKVSDYEKNQRQKMQQDVLGINLDDNKLIEAKKFNARSGGVELDNLELNQVQFTYGRLVNVKSIMTKKQEPMAFLTFDNGIDQFDVTAFPQVYQKIIDMLANGEIYLLKLRTQNDRYNVTEKQFILQDLKKLNFENLV